ncbi:MAG: hypothetical protein RIS36_121 [Pseudomonadota bacterium]|jgi:hypothetical protein
MVQVAKSTKDFELFERRNPGTVRVGVRLVHLLLLIQGSRLYPCLLESTQYEIINSRALTSSEAGSTGHYPHDADDANDPYKTLKSLKKTVETNGGSGGRGPERVRKGP